MIKLHIVEGPVTSTFKFASREELIRTLSNTIRGAPLNAVLAFSIEENKKNDRS